jgi:hypothetical protein
MNTVCSYLWRKAPNRTARMPIFCIIATRTGVLHHLHSNNAPCTLSSSRLIRAVSDRGDHSPSSRVIRSNVHRRQESSPPSQSRSQSVTRRSTEVLPATAALLLDESYPTPQMEHHAHFHPAPLHLAAMALRCLGKRPRFSVPSLGLARWHLTVTLGEEPFSQRAMAYGFGLSRSIG